MIRTLSKATISITLPNPLTATSMGHLWPTRDTSATHSSREMIAATQCAPLVAFAVTI